MHIQQVNDNPIVYNASNLEEIIEECVKEQTLEAARVRACIWHTDHIIRSHVPGNEYTTCFGYLLGEVEKHWYISHPETKSLAVEDQCALIEALSLYGNPQFYHGVSFRFDRPTGGFDEDFDHSEEYERDMPGKYAREVLTSLVEKLDKGGPTLIKKDVKLENVDNVIKAPSIKEVTTWTQKKTAELQKEKPGDPVIPEIKDIVGRGLEEFVELCLEVGMDTGRIYNHVNDSVHNQCVKMARFAKMPILYPSRFFTDAPLLPFDRKEIVGEMVDVTLLLKYALGLINIDEQKFEEAQVAKWTKFTNSSNGFHVGPTGMLYMKKAHTESTNPT